MDKSHFLRHEQEDIFKFKTGFLAFFFSMFGLIITGMFIPS